MTHQFKRQVAEYLADHHNQECRGDIAQGIEYSYRAKPFGNGLWCVWCDGSDHYVEFDQLGNGSAH